ncbi:MAG: cupin [Actinobacteria bacterium HGW-Actinobacteria-2]|nr:MAG: cupin [Actinobacteria bacterium HGW-Actinobacteria-2]
MTNALHGTALTAVLGAPVPKATTITPGQTEADVELWADGVGASTGFWECTAGTFTSVRDGYSEVCQIVSGSVTIHTDGADPFTLVAGDTVVLPDGWRGSWEVHETVRKLYVMIPTTAAASADDLS